ncbi:hypothetical protein AAZX31_13G225500 [Glycine max]|uniref:Tyrosinase copper-binding domain-containing protein n=1 Tax=Glycine max TaxID=3847 RepID=K7M1M4_SOYBN|nr:hypothetical protein GYH30_037232 [Glycine max]KRH21501.1 hypothetical protein GLYMA_13G242400v4 [Glycine max]
MASIPHLSFVSTVNNFSPYSTTPPSSLHPFSQFQSAKYKKPKHHHIPRVTCSGNQNNPTPNPSEGEPPHIVGHRRSVLFGLGGFCGASTLNNNNPFAFAAPLSPDITTCDSPNLPAGAEPTNCCPPPSASTNIIDFEFPPSNQPLRVRPAAHSVNDDYVAKFERALNLMKNLPSDDPRNFTQLANAHCAYLHGSWIFFPFHRWYLYFYERILGSLINDPTFAIPFWNWDSPQGMQIPSIYANPTSPLYDTLRSANHQPPTVIDLDFNIDNPGAGGNISTNLTIMYRQVVSNGRTPTSFLGDAYHAGDELSLGAGAGSLENVPHGTVHLWTGDSNQPNFEDMGTFYSAARDPIFYSHHSNLDRIWSIWKKTLGGRDFTDSDWLESGFLFYDENKNLVRVKVKDCLDERKLGYAYQDVDIPWSNSRPTPQRSRVQKVGTVAHVAETSRNVKFPLMLDSVVTTMVKRPKRSRSKKEEILVVEGIEFEKNTPVKFDMIINGEDYKLIKPDNSEFAGSFVSVPHSHKHKNKNIVTSLKLGLTDVLQDLGAENDDSVMVTLVPRFGKGRIKIRNIKIEFIAD